MVAVAAYGQRNATTSSYGPNAAAAVDAIANLHVPDD
jgi:hypothetical protein